MVRINSTEVRVYMARQNLNGSSLATLAGIARQTLSRALHGKNCTEVTVGRIAGALNCDPADIAEETA